MATPAIAGRQVVVVGAGKSGRAAAKLCHALGARVVLNDQRATIDRGDLPEAIELAGGGHEAALFARAEMIVLSPGVPKLAVVDDAIARGVRVTGEIELASTLVRAPLLAITGTNGKSTVTALTGALVAQNGKPTFVGGNLGTPLAEAIGTPAVAASGQVVIELSSYQLETCETLHPRGAALLNLTPDHLDRYASITAYGEAKLRIAQNQTVGDVLVYNADDAFFAVAVGRFPLPQRRSFSVRSTDADAFVDGDDLVLKLDREERYPIASLQIIGRHNLANALAALLLVRATNLASYDEARAGLAAFTALPHRMQLVGERGGVRYYDDSKATNVDSVVAGIDGFPVPFVLIAGGRDKGGSYAPLVAAIERNRCTRVLLIGEAAPLLERALGTTIGHERCATLPDAVARGAAIAKAGEAVVLSPACSSFDMFDNYAHRGAVFRAAVEGL